MSEMPIVASMTARKARAGDWVSKLRAYGCNSPWFSHFRPFVLRVVPYAC